jgi:surface carbohydrate biosynthesis protein
LKKICILVDHPSRDLRSILLLAYELIKKNYLVYLIEMYKKNEIYLICPDILILQTATDVHKKILEECKANGISVCILDSEGGYDARGGLKYLKQEILENINYIDYYFLWGYYSYKILYSKKIKDKLIITGSPKSDLLYYYRADKRKKKYILINTSFPISTPRFTTYFDQKKNLQSQLKNYGKKNVNAFLDEQNKSKKNFFKLIVKLIRDFPQYNFVIRPHPFEDFKEYIYLKKKYSNIDVAIDEDLYKNISEAKGMIQLNCQTAFEYFVIAKTKSLFPVFANNKILYKKDMIKISSPIYSYNSLKKKIIKIYEFNQRSKRFFLKKNIENIFYKIDGKAVKRIVQYLEKIKFKKINYEFSKNFYKFNTTNDFINVFAYFINVNIFNFFKNLLIIKDRSKELSSEKIYKIIKTNLYLNKNKVIPFQLRRANNKDLSSKFIFSLTCFKLFKSKELQDKINYK